MRSVQPTRRQALQGAFASLFASAAFANRDHPATAERIVVLLQCGGPSQLDLFDYKPELEKRNGEPHSGATLQATGRTFQPHGRGNIYFSDLLPRIAAEADEIAMFHGVANTSADPAEAQLLTMTGSPKPGNPSLGSWIVYTIGSEGGALPGFFVLKSGVAPAAGAGLTSPGFFPAFLGGVPFPYIGEADPAGLATRDTADLVRELMDLEAKEKTGAADIQDRLAQYRLAVQLRSAESKLLDFTNETPDTLSLYGGRPGATAPASPFATNCLLARRLLMSGVRFVLLTHTGWDTNLEQTARDVDTGAGALITDLRRRGLLRETLVVWAGEFGRSPLSTRAPQPEAYSLFMAGGGVKPATITGSTDDLGFPAKSNRIPLHDIQATILHTLGIDHNKLSIRNLGVETRLIPTDAQVLRDALV